MKKNSHTEETLEQLKKVEKMLSRGAFTAKSVGKTLKVSTMTAYRYIWALQKTSKRKVKQKEVRQGARGPASVAFYI